MNQKQREYLAYRVNEEVKIKVKALKEQEGVTYDLEGFKDDINEIIKKHWYFLTFELPDIKGIRHYFGESKTPTGVNDYARVTLSKVTMDEIEKVRLKTVDKYNKAVGGYNAKVEKIEKEAKKVKDAVMLGAESEALKRLENFIKFEVK